jgi:hypothetical protein
MEPLQKKICGDGDITSGSIPIFHNSLLTLDCYKNIP